jgi:hypothetical protein
MSKVYIEAFWVNATADDIAEIIKTGELVPARFRDSDTDDWQEYSVSLKLAGWKLRRSDVAWIDADGASWKQCQVYREPSWHANKPDPGPGFRLLEKFPPEAKLGTDEYWSGEGWMPAGSRDNDQAEQVWYRRRIEPVKPKFAVGQTVKVVGPKVKPAKDWGKEMDRHVGLAGVIRSIPILEGEGTFYNLEGIGIWCFREDYLEAVEPEPAIALPIVPKHFIAMKGDVVQHLNGLTLTATEKGFEVTQ